MTQEVEALQRIMGRIKARAPSEIVARRGKEVQEEVAALELAIQVLSPGQSAALPTYKVSSDKSTLVGDYRFVRTDVNTPRGYKVQLYGKGGCAVYGHYDLDPFWVGWFPVPGAPL